MAVINKDYQVAERIVHACLSCTKKLDSKLQALNQYYANQVALEMREWLLEVRAQNTQ
jgi:hypothetical protein